jgi:hypothetical protein
MEVNPRMIAPGKEEMEGYCHKKMRVINRPFKPCVTVR